MNRCFVLLFFALYFSVCFAQKKTNPTVDSIFSIVEQMPEFPGGEAEMMKYIGRNLKYPIMSEDCCIHGRVVIKFVVGSDGMVRDANVMRTSGSAILDSAFMVPIVNMPKWKAGKHEGRTVPVYFTIPILFRPK